MVATHAASISIDTSLRFLPPRLPVKLGFDRVVVIRVFLRIERMFAFTKFSEKRRVLRGLWWRVQGRMHGPSLAWLSLHGHESHWVRNLRAFAGDQTSLPSSLSSHYARVGLDTTAL